MQTVGILMFCNTSGHRGGRNSGRGEGQKYDASANRFEQHGPLVKLMPRTGEPKPGGGGVASDYRICYVRIAALL